MRRWALLAALPLLLVAMLIASPAGLVAAQDEAPFGDDVVTATTTVNLRIRSEPSLDAEILAVLPAGTIVGFTGFMDETGDWVQVDAADGPTGWVWASWLSNVPEDLQVWSGEEAAEDEAADDEAAAPAPAFSEDVVTATTTANLNIRTGPGVSFERLATLPFGTVVGFTGFTDVTGEWVQVETLDGILGWVSAAYLSEVPEGLQVPPEDAPAEAEPTEEEPAEPAEPPFSEDVVTATTTVNLNLRSEPSLDAEILAVLPAGSIVGFTGFMDETGDWVQVDAADGPTGWVWASWLSNVPEDLNVWTGDSE